MVSNSTENNPARRGALFVSLGSYLKKLKAIERTMPPDQRLKVPSLTELASSVNSNRTTMSRLARGDMVTLNLALAGAIIREMRRRGFHMEITDLIDYIGPPPRPRPKLGEKEIE